MRRKETKKGAMDKKTSANTALSSVKPNGIQICRTEIRTRYKTFKRIRKCPRMQNKGTSGIKRKNNLAFSVIPEYHRTL